MDLQKADNLRCCCREMLSENGQLRQENIKMRNQLLAYSKQFNEIHVAFYKVSKYAQKAYDDYANMWPQDAPMIEILPDFGEYDFWWLSHRLIEMQFGIVISSEEEDGDNVFCKKNYDFSEENADFSQKIVFFLHFLKFHEYFVHSSCAGASI